MTRFDGGLWPPGPGVWSRRFIWAGLLGQRAPGSSSGRDRRCGGGGSSILGGICRVGVTVEGGSQWQGIGGGALWAPGFLLDPQHPACPGAPPSPAPSPRTRQRRPSGPRGGPLASGMCRGRRRPPTPHLSAALLFGQREVGVASPGTRFPSSLGAKWRLGPIWGDPGREHACGVTHACSDHGGGSRG